MRIRSMVLLIALMLVSCVPLMAQQQRGDVEIGLQALYAADTEGNFGVGIIQGKLGSFFTDEIELGITPSLQISTFKTTSFDFQTGRTSTSSQTTTTFGAGAFLTYSFLAKDATTVPYIGGQYYKPDFDNSDDKGSAGINGGLKFYLTTKAAFDISGNYIISLNEDATGGMLLFVAGISFLF